MNNCTSSVTERLERHRHQATAWVGIAASIAGVTSIAGAGDIVHNGNTYGAGETLTIQLSSALATWSVDFGVRTNVFNSGTFNSWFAGNIQPPRTSYTGPGVKGARPGYWGDWTSNSPIPMHDRSTGNWGGGTTAILVSRPSDGYIVPDWGPLQSGPSFIVIADMRWDGTYFDYLQVGWIEVFHDQDNEALIIGDWYLGAPGEQVTLPPPSLPGSAVPGLPGLGVLACGAAGLRRNRQRVPTGRGNI